MPDVVVVGGGVVGAAAARKLASDRDVVLVERASIAAGATGRAAGEVTMAPSYSDVPAVAEHANDFFRTYDGTCGFSYHEADSFELVPPDREGEARRRARRLHGEGLDVAFLEPEAVEERYRRFDLAEFVGIVRQGDTGYLDPHALTTSLVADARERGATVRTDTPVREVIVEGGSVRGVRTPDGQIAAGVVVVAAGSRTPELLSGLVELPVRPYRTQCVILEPREPLSDGFPMGWVPEAHVYFRPTTAGNLLVGGWAFPVDDPDAASREADEAFREHVADVVPSFLEGFDRATVVDDWAGVDTATPDTRPIVDAPDDAPTGLVVATGFHGRGVMTAPVAATAVRALLADEEPPFPLDPFRLDRFDDRSPDFEFHSISSG